MHLPKKSYGFQAMQMTNQWHMNELEKSTMVPISTPHFHCAMISLSEIPGVKALQWNEHNKYWLRGFSMAQYCFMIILFKDLDKWLNGLWFRFPNYILYSAVTCAYIWRQQFKNILWLAVLTCFLVYYWRKTLAQIFSSCHRLQLKSINGHL